MDTLRCVLMVSGWLLSMAAMLLLKWPGQRLGFLTSAILVEVLGLGVIAHHRRSMQRGA